MKVTRSNNMLVDGQMAKNDCSTSVDVCVCGATITVTTRDMYDKCDGVVVFSERQLATLGSVLATTD